MWKRNSVEYCSSSKIRPRRLRLGRKTSLTFLVGCHGGAEALAHCGPGCSLCLCLGSVFHFLGCVWGVWGPCLILGESH